VWIALFTRCTSKEDGFIQSESVLMKEDPRLMERDMKLQLHPADADLRIIPTMNTHPTIAPAPSLSRELLSSTE
jgi:hypothetical protein